MSSITLRNDVLNQSIASAIVNSWLLPTIAGMPTCQTPLIFSVNQGQRMGKHFKIDLRGEKNTDFSEG